MYRHIQPCRCFLHWQITWSTRSHVSNFEFTSWTKNTRIYPSSGSSCGYNSPTSSDLIFMKTGVTKGEQRARLFHVWRGVVWISCPYLKGSDFFYRWSYGLLTMMEFPYNLGSVTWCVGSQAKISSSRSEKDRPTVVFVPRSFYSWCPRHFFVVLPSPA
jgi:hypothetical protein